MQQFVKHIFKIVFVLIISAYALDFVFTYVYQNSAPQNKAHYIYSLQNQHFDYIFIGSSRVENSIIPDIIEKKTNKKVLNLGITALKLKDISYILELLETYNIKYHKIFVQIDYSYNEQEGYSKFYSTELLPFCTTSNVVIDSYFESTKSNYLFYKYIPFLKYSNAQHLIGFRKIFTMLNQKPAEIILNKGYVPIYGTSTKVDAIIPNSIIKSNKYLAKINEFGIKKNKNLIYFSAPVLVDTKSTSYFNKLKNNVAGLQNFNAVFMEDKYFYNNCHINHDGAVVFTNILIEKLKL